MKFVITAAFLKSNDSDKEMLRKRWMMEVRRGYVPRLNIKSIKHLANILFEKTDNLKTAKYVEMDFSEIDLAEEEKSILEESCHILIKNGFNGNDPDNAPFFLDMSNKYGFDSSEYFFEEAKEKENLLREQILSFISADDKEKVDKLLQDLIIHVSSHSGPYA